MTATPKCPACHARTGLAPRDRIDLAELHTHWAPGDATLQRQLTEAAAEGAPHGYQMFHCEQCGLEFPDPLAAPDGRWYVLAYFRPEPFPPDRWDHAVVLDALSPRDVLLEIGCGSGSFLQKCADRNVRAAGVDLSEEHVRQCRAAGLDVRLLDVRDADTGPVGEGASAMAAFQVLEHLDCPDDLFALARRHSAGDATLWVAIPSNQRPERRLGERDFRDEPPHHMTRWTSAALEAVGGRNGWKLEEVRYQPISVSTALWWLTTRAAWYRRLRGKTIRRLARLVALPFVYLHYLASHRAMSGFNMLARYRQTTEEHP